MALCNIHVVRCDLWVKKKADILSLSSTSVPGDETPMMLVQKMEGIALDPEKQKKGDNLEETWASLFGRRGVVTAFLEATDDSVFFCDSEGTRDRLLSRLVGWTNYRRLLNELSPRASWFLTAGHSIVNVMSRFHRRVVSRWVVPLCTLLALCGTLFANVHTLLLVPLMAVAAYGGLASTFQRLAFGEKTLRLSHAVAETVPGHALALLWTIPYRGCDGKEALVLVSLIVFAIGVFGIAVMFFFVLFPNRRKQERCMTNPFLAGLHGFVVINAGVLLTVAFAMHCPFSFSLLGVAIVVLCVFPITTWVFDLIRQHDNIHKFDSAAKQKRIDKKKSDTIV